MNAENAPSGNSDVPTLFQETESVATTAEELLGPPKVDAASLGLSILSGLVSGFVGGLVVLASVGVFLGKMKLGAPGIFPYALSLVAFFSILLSAYLTGFLNSLIFPNKYRGGITAFAQSFALSILVFIFAVPLYVYVGARAEESDRLIFVFTFHCLMATFGISLLSEIVSNYRYAALSVYSGFSGFFLASAASLAVFLGSTDSVSSLYALVGAIGVVTFLVNAFRVLAEFAYYRFYAAVGADPLGNVYARIEEEEKEALAEAERELTRF